MSDKKGRKNESIHWIFAIVGIALIVAGTILLVKTESFKKNAIQTEATITKIEMYNDSDDETQYDVRIEFYAGDTKIEGSLGYHVSGMKKGQTVKIYYTPDDPNNFQSASAGIWVFVVFIVLGVPFSLAGFLPLIMKIITAIKKRKVQL